MAKSLSRSNKEIADLYECHVNMVYRICFAYMKNTTDTEDMVQSTFVKLIEYSGKFENIEHEKAWLIRTASNQCIDNLRRKWRKDVPLEKQNIYKEPAFEINEILQAVLQLPDKYKTIVYMYYYEGYTSAEIANTLGKPKSTVRNYLHEARGLLRERLGDEFDE